MFQRVKWARRGSSWRLVFKWLMLDLIHVLNLVLLAAFGFSNPTKSWHIHNDGLGQIQHSTAWVKSMIYPFLLKIVDCNGCNNLGNLWNMPHWNGRLFDTEQIVWPWVSHVLKVIGNGVVRSSVTWYASAQPPYIFSKVFCFLFQMVKIYKNIIVVALSLVKIRISYIFNVLSFRCT